MYCVSGSIYIVYLNVLVILILQFGYAKSNQTSLYSLISKFIYTLGVGMK